MGATETIGKETYTERPITFGRGGPKVYCPYHLKTVDITSAKGCLPVEGQGGCKFLSSVAVGKIICKWTKADGFAK